MNKFNISYLKGMTKKNRLPFIAHWNLNEFCNLKCVHCCVPKTPRFVKLEDAYKVIDFLKVNNFFLITLSGGECLLHPNFKEIYMGLKKAGMYASVFTNGTTFTDEIKELFAEYKPRKVEVSVYGIDEETFYKNTGSTSGYRKFLSTLDFLSSQNIRTVIKAPITTTNYMNLDKYIALANKYNAEYKFGTFVFPMINGDKTPLDYRLGWKEAVGIEFGDRGALTGYANRVNSKGYKAENFTEKCAACTNSYTINADNSFSFCGMMTEPKFYFNDEVSIEEAFAQVTAFREKVIEMYNNSPCEKCDYANGCPGCPAHLLLETGKVTECNHYFEKITYEKIKYLYENGLLKLPLPEKYHNSALD